MFCSVLCETGGQYFTAGIGSLFMITLVAHVLYVTMLQFVEVLLSIVTLSWAQKVAKIPLTLRGPTTTKRYRVKAGCDKGPPEDKHFYA